LSLKQHTTIPVGAGDEASRPADMEALIDAGAIDVVRLDATTIGGVNAVQQLSARARSKGLLVSFHEHPDIHQHCALACGADHVEMFPIDQHFDRVHDLIQTPPLTRVSHGWLQPSHEPGTRIALRADALAPIPRRSANVEA
jgi:L-alanine-DL-glutamate epimerase-like enolase superfamily enzyme